MSRSQRRAVGRRSMLHDLISGSSHRKTLSDREKLAVMWYERDIEMAEIAGTPTTTNSTYERTLASVASGDTSARMEATQRLEDVKSALPPSIRRMLGEIERCNTTRRGSLSGLPIKSGLSVEREHALVCVGALKTMLACLADGYRLPEEA